MLKAVRYLLSTLLIFFLSRCAQTGILTGGERDRIPPKLINAEPALAATHFSANIITLQFDEYIQLNNPAKEIVITPRLEKQPEIITKGKKLSIDFSLLRLKPNTTYQINFGNSIADMNERNTLANFIYVFSTGDHIDSLKLSGQILQAEDNAPANPMLLAIYPNEEALDSLPYKKEPTYYCTANSEGFFEMKHLPQGSYQVFAIEDKNNNRLYDGNLERIAFYTGALDLQSDSTLLLHAFKEPVPNTFVSKSFSPNYGRALIILNQTSDWKIKALHPNDQKKISVDKTNIPEDTIVVFYHQFVDTLPLLLQIAGRSEADTLYLKVPPIRKRALAVPHLTLPSSFPKPNDRPIIRFDTWLDTAKTNYSKMIWKSDLDTTERHIQLKAHWLNVHQLQLHVPLTAARSYSLHLDSSVFVDQNGNRPDSLTLSEKTKSQKDFGKLFLKIRFKSKQQYIVELLNEQGKKVSEQTIFFSLSSSNVASLEFTELPPGSYKIRIVYDSNSNGKWDAGNFLKREQPEKISILSKQIKVISDWELEEELDEK